MFPFFSIVHMAVIPFLSQFLYVRSLKFGLNLSSYAIQLNNLTFFSNLCLLLKSAQIVSVWEVIGSIEPFSSFYQCNVAQKGLHWFASHPHLNLFPFGVIMLVTPLDQVVLPHNNPLNLGVPWESPPILSQL